MSELHETCYDWTLDRCMRLPRSALLAICLHVVTRSVHDDVKELWFICLHCKCGGKRKVLFIRYSSFVPVCFQFSVSFVSHYSIVFRFCVHFGSIFPFFICPVLTLVIPVFRFCVHFGSIFPFFHFPVLAHVIPLFRFCVHFGSIFPFLHFPVLVHYYRLDYHIMDINPHKI